MENNIKEEVHLEKKRQPWDDLALTLKFMKSLVQCWANSKHHQERKHLDSPIYSRVQGKQHETEVERETHLKNCTHPNISGSTIYNSQPMGTT